MSKTNSKTQVKPKTTPAPKEIKLVNYALPLAFETFQETQIWINLSKHTYDAWANEAKSFLKTLLVSENISQATVQCLEMYACPNDVSKVHDLLKSVDGKCAEAYNLLGFYESKNYQEAIQHFLKAKEVFMETLKPEQIKDVVNYKLDLFSTLWGRTYLRSLLALGNCYRKSCMYEQALQYFEEAHKLNPTHAYTDPSWICPNIYIPECYAHLGKIDQVWKYIGEARTDPKQKTSVMTPHLYVWEMFVEFLSPETTGKKFTERGLYNTYWVKFRFWIHKPDLFGPVSEKDHGPIPTYFTRMSNALYISDPEFNQMVRDNYKLWKDTKGYENHLLRASNSLKITQYLTCHSKSDSLANRIKNKDFKKHPNMIDVSKEEFLQILDSDEYYKDQRLPDGDYLACCIFGTPFEDAEELINRGHTPKLAAGEFNHLMLAAYYSPDPRYVEEFAKHFNPLAKNTQKNKDMNDLDYLIEDDVISRSIQQLNYWNIEVLLLVVPEAINQRYLAQLFMLTLESTVTHCLRGINKCQRCNLVESAHAKNCSWEKTIDVLVRCGFQMNKQVKDHCKEIFKDFRVLRPMMGWMADYVITRLSDKFCRFCGIEKDRLLKCGGCMLMSYCSQDCQKKGWKLHKHYCESVKMDKIDSK